MPVMQYSGLLVRFEGPVFTGLPHAQVISRSEYNDEAEDSDSDSEEEISSFLATTPKSYLGKNYERFHLAYLNASTSLQISSIDNLKLADLGLAFYALAHQSFPAFKAQTEDKILSGKVIVEDFIKKNSPFLLELGLVLKNSQDEDEREAGLNFSELALEVNPALKEEKVTLEEDRAAFHSLQLYQTLSGEICLKFQSEEEKESFLKSYGPAATIEKQFRLGAQFKYNPDGVTPVCYSRIKNAVYFPSYRAGGGELAINFGSQEKKEKFLTILGLALPKPCAYNTLTMEYKNNQGKVIFCTYGGSQSSTIYFGEEGSNETAFDAGSYLRFEKEKGQDAFSIYSCTRQLISLDAGSLQLEKEQELAKMKTFS